MGKKRIFESYRVCRFNEHLVKTDRLAGKWNLGATANDRMCVGIGMCIDMVSHKPQNRALKLEHKNLDCENLELERLILEMTAAGAGITSEEIDQLYQILMSCAACWCASWAMKRALRPWLTMPT